MTVPFVCDRCGEFAGDYQELKSHNCKARSVSIVLTLIIKGQAAKDLPLKIQNPPDNKALFDKCRELAEVFKAGDA